MHQNGLYFSEFFNIISYICMSPLYHGNNISLFSIAQNRVLFPDDGLTKSLWNIKNLFHNFTFTQMITWRDFIAFVRALFIFGYKLL